MGTAILGDVRVDKPSYPQLKLSYEQQAAVQHPEAGIEHSH